MKIRDLGEIKGDMLLFGGIYSNLSALEALLSKASEYKIPPENCICTGDIVAYCAHAEESVNRLRDFDCPILAGNCEIQFAANALDCGCGYDDGSECSILSRGWYAHATDKVSAANKEWMGTLPERIIFTHNDLKYGVVHGGATDISRFIWPVTDDATIAAEIETLTDQIGPVDCIIAGHSGIPMQRKVGNVLWQNTGAIGMPAHNGSSETSYGAILNNSFKINMLKYDIDVEYDAMIKAGLTQGYHKTLKSGYWPSEDTLPLEMRL